MLYNFTADGFVTGATQARLVNIKSVFFSGVGVTVGDRVAIRSGGPQGDVKILLVASTANGTFGFTMPDGGVDVLNPYYSEQKTGGTIWGHVVTA